ncbi:MAG: hypothetical protein WC310_04385 [Patescibacteria group bacterium]|jgi:hypothetical protein
MRNKTIIIAIVSFALGALIYNLFSPVIFQEGNPWPQIKGITELTFGKSKIVKLSGSDNKYLTKNKGGWEVADSLLKNKGYEFTEQMGSGYFYKSSDSNAVMTRRQYSRFYIIWAITENKNNFQTNNDLWTVTTNDQGIMFKYPRELLTKYISETEWPPVIKIKTGTYFCKTTPMEVSSMSEITRRRLVDDREYCVNVKYEGAAGSVYASYIYTTFKDDELIEVSFSLRYYNCGNYDEEQNKACVSEREVFDIDATVDKIVQTIKRDLSQKESLSDQIEKCIIMSDIVSGEKCDNLLKQITDYNSCVEAGFAIMKSNPPQCATPDERIFVETKI